MREMFLSSSVSAWECSPGLGWLFLGEMWVHILLWLPDFPQLSLHQTSRRWDGVKTPHVSPQQVWGVSEEIPSSLSPGLGFLCVLAHVPALPGRSYPRCPRLIPSAVSWLPSLSVSLCISYRISSPINYRSHVCLSVGFWRNQSQTIRLNNYYDHFSFILSSPQ